MEKTEAIHIPLHKIESSSNSFFMNFISDIHKNSELKLLVQKELIKGGFAVTEEFCL